MPESELEVTTDLEVTEEVTEEPTTEGETPEVEEETTEETTEEEVVVEETAEEKLARIEKQNKKLKNRNISLLKQRNRARAEAEAVVKPPEKPQRPKITQFKTEDGELDLEKYEDAMDTYDSSHEEYQKATAPKPAETPEQARLNKQLELGTEKYEDFEEVAMSKDVPYSPFMAKAVLASDHAADLAYHFGQNLDVAQEISDMSNTNELKAAKMIIEIEKSFNGKNKVANINRPPKPLKTVSGKGEADVAKDPTKMSTAEWIKWDRAKTLKKIKQKVEGG